MCVSDGRWCSVGGWMGGWMGGWLGGCAVCVGCVWRAACRLGRCVWCECGVSVVWVAGRRVRGGLVVLCVCEGAAVRGLCVRWVVVLCVVAFGDGGGVDGCVRGGW